METTRTLSPAFRGRRSLVLGAALAAFVLAAPAGATAKTHVKTVEAAVPDAAGDAAAPGIDITSVSARYKSDGSLKVSVTTAGPIDTAANDAWLGVWLGNKACTKYSVSVGGQFGAPGSAAGYLQLTPTKHGKLHSGAGALAGNTYTVTVKHKAFKNLKVGCFWGQLLNPSDGAILDETPAIQMTKG